MKIFAISDLHLSTGGSKPMDVFGEKWEGHWEKIKKDWEDKVSTEDIVLLAGDLSWGITLEEAMPDLKEIASLNGNKVIIKGNHDYWWQTVSKLRKSLPDNFYIVQNNCIRINNILICGSRLWVLNAAEERDKKVLDREYIRLDLSLNEMEKQRREGDYVIVMCHYPPFEPSMKDTRFTELIASHNVNCVVYGHLHGNKTSSKIEVNKKGISYYLTSCDKLDNELLQIAVF